MARLPELTVFLKHWPLMALVPLHCVVVVECREPNDESKTSQRICASQSS